MAASSHIFGRSACAAAESANAEFARNANGNAKMPRIRDGRTTDPINRLYFDTALRPSIAILAISLFVSRAIGLIFRKCGGESQARSSSMLLADDPAIAMTRPDPKRAEPRSRPGGSRPAGISWNCQLSWRTISVIMTSRTVLPRIRTAVSLSASRRISILFDAVKAPSNPPAFA